jgi:hypothetical protein
MPASDDHDKPKFHTVRIRRRPLYEWLLWLVWLIALALLLEFVLSSLAEYERQAATLAGALFVGLLLAGLIVWFVRRVEAEERDKRH